MRTARQRDANTLRLNDLASSIEAVERKAAVVVFRDCFMNTLETAYQLRNAAEFMVASQSVVPVAGVWPWGGFLSALMPSAASGDVGRALAMQLARFLDEPANRGPFADVPYSLIDLGAAEAIVEPLKALADALDAARGDAEAVGGLRGGARRRARRLSGRSVESWRSGAARRADALRQAAGARTAIRSRRPRRRWATWCGTGWCDGTTRRRGVSGDEPLLPAGDAARHRAVVHPVRQRRGRGAGCRALRASSRCARRPAGTGSR